MWAAQQTNAIYDPNTTYAFRTNGVGEKIPVLGVQGDQIVGPAAVRSGNGQGYSVVATMPRNTSEEQFRLMLQSRLPTKSRRCQRFMPRSRPTLRSGRTTKDFRRCLRDYPGDS